MMRRSVQIISLLAVVLIMWSCSQGGHESEGHQHEQVESTNTSGELKLNNGARWVVDSTTSDNYVNLQTITNMFGADPLPSLNSYQIYGNDMGRGLNKLIQECRMKGPDHDALHVWLEPIFKQVSDLKNVSDTVEAKKIFDSVKTRIDIFNNYFTEAK